MIEICLVVIVEDDSYLVIMYPSVSINIILEIHSKNSIDNIKINKKYMTHQILTLYHINKFYVCSQNTL